MSGTPAPTASADETGQRAAWAWVAHLRRGGTRPWHEWREAADRPGGDQQTLVEDRGPYLPGAQQLELLRRLNDAARAAHPPPASLVERVLTASAPGRGIPDLELVGAARPSRFGARPVDPADLPDAELVRVASGLLADDVVAAGPPPEPRVGRPRPWRRGRYRLVGDPWLADPARAELVRRGRPPGGRSPIVLVLGTDLATMLTHAWTVRAFSDGAPRWREWVDPLARSGRVPRRVDLPAYAATWAERLGPDRVEVVLDPGLLPRLVGVRRPLPGPPRLSADAVELTRLVGAALGLLVLPERRAELLRRTWGPRLTDLPGPALCVPTSHHDALLRRAVRMRDDLLEAGYPVHGDPDALLPALSAADRPEQGEPDDARVLALALRLLLDPAPAPPDPNEEVR